MKRCVALRGLLLGTRSSAGLETWCCECRVGGCRAHGLDGRSLRQPGSWAQWQQHSGSKDHGSHAAQVVGRGAQGAVDQVQQARTLLQLQAKRARG